ncbi:hypothetical protein D0T23_26440 [Duganella sp. BJB475]|nr:hypothetical protein D0T23_26440 [Duganella sp. BJB475]RFP13141.1 hypothetical protein D0T26_22875 [Duganella sp. BJB489]RFP25286.1 hypothetical protein D0T21_27470 [Duganella sp. BJB476]
MQHYVMEYQTVLRAMTLAAEVIKVSEQQGHAPSLQILEMSADVMVLFTGITERLQAQIRRRELEIDLVLVTLIRENCDCLVDIISCLARGAPSEHLLAVEGRAMRQHAAQMFQRYCVLTLAGNRV